MKRPVIAVLFCGLSSYAHAQLTVIDPASIAQEIQDALKEFGYLQQQLQTQAGILNQLTSGINVNLDNLGNPLPNSSSIQQMVQGSTNGFGLQSLVAQILAQNQYYKPNGTDFQATQINTNAQSAANLQALTQQQMAAIDGHITALQDMAAQISPNMSQANLQSLETQIVAEQAALNAEETQMQSITAAYNAQVAVEQQAQLQAIRQSADWLNQNSQPLSGTADFMPTGGAAAGPAAFNANGG